MLNKNMAHSVLTQAALTLAQQGFRVFPLAPRSKKPNRKPDDESDTWPALVTRDPVKIIQDRLQYPDGNVGIATGEGLAVLDIDTKKGKDGLRSLHILQDESGQLPKTLRASTTTGGQHLYFRYDARVHSLGNRTNFRDGLDLRADGGYVVAPPSLLANGSYVWIDEVPIAEMPEWLIGIVDRNAREREKASGDFLSGGSAFLDALRYLNTAAPAVEGDGGDARTYQVACRVRDFGVSPDAALELMSTAWNSRCAPPWDLGELQSKIENAYRYGLDKPASQTAEALFSDDDTARRAREHQKVSEEVRAQEAFEAVRPAIIRPLTVGSLPARRWVVQDFLIEKKLTTLVAPGGVGKSSLTLLAALAVVTGRADLLNMAIRPHLIRSAAASLFDDDDASRARALKDAATVRSSAWVWNNEDDMEELERRMLALLELYDIDPADLGAGAPSQLYLNSGEQRPLQIAAKRAVGKGFVVEPVDAEAVTAHIVANNIKLLVVDPFVETHNADENNNSEISAVGTIYRQIAQQGDCAVLLVHHTRKPAAGASDAHIGSDDSARGAKALTDKARANYTLYGMDDKSAKALGVAKDNQWRYIRLDGGKRNLSPNRDAAVWFEKVGVDLLTSDGVTESVGAIRTWNPFQPVDTPDPAEDAQALIDAIGGVARSGAISSLPDVIRMAMQWAPYCDQNEMSLRRKAQRLLATERTTTSGDAVKVVAAKRRCDGYTVQFTSRKK